MPNANRIQTLYVVSGNPDTVNELPSSTTNVGTYPRTGQLGQAGDFNDRAYQYVQLDSGATASSSAGVVAANEVAYWKDRSQYIVTNDSSQALFANTANSFRNNVAGIFRNAVTAGNYCYVLQRGRSISVKEAGSATPGMILVSDTSATAAQALGTAIGTAPPVQPLGVVVTATAANVCTADIDIPNIP